jgi:hypothetical protein
VVQEVKVQEAKESNSKDRRGANVICTKRDSDSYGSRVANSGRKRRKIILK